MVPQVQPQEAEAGAQRYSGARPDTGLLFPRVNFFFLNSPPSTYILGALCKNSCLSKTDYLAHAVSVSDFQNNVPHLVQSSQVSYSSAPHIQQRKATTP